MAEVLLRIKDHVNPDPAEDLRSSWKRGHVIAVEEDGFAWGRKEDIRQWLASGEAKESWHGTTALLLIPGVPKADLAYALQSLYDVVSEGQILARRRSWKIALTKVPATVRNALARDYLYTVTRAQWDAAMEYVGL